MILIMFSEAETKLIIVGILICILSIPFMFLIVHIVTKESLKNLKKQRAEQKKDEDSTGTK